MPAVLYRVDNRLIHGQVLEGWAARLGVDSLLVADQALYEDEFQKMILEGMGQGSYDIRILPPGEAAKLLAAAWADRKVIVLFRTPADALAAYRAGIVFTELNIGNIHPSASCRELSSCVYLGSDDEVAIKTLLAEGVSIELCPVPGSKCVDVAERLREDRTT